MTAPMLGRAGRDVLTAVERMKRAGWERDQAMNRIRLVRDGKFSEVWPDHFSEAYPTSLVANFVDVAARDLASNLAPLPSLACSAGTMKTEVDKRRAEKKNRIAANYWRHSKLEVQMKYGADQYLSYGFLPVWIEADYKNKLPFIHIEDPEGAYFEMDRQFRTTRYMREWKQSTAELAALFPEYADRILYNSYGEAYDDTDITVVRYIDGDCVMIYLPARSQMVVASYQHGQRRCPVHIALRPGLNMNPRGQFDDVLWVQLAHTVWAALTLEAGHKAVEAPIAVPKDVQELPFGPDAILRSDSPEKIGRVRIDLPPSVFALGEQLQTEMKEGAGYPDSRLGNVTSSAITGRGISALEGGFDSQIKNGQDVLKLMLIEATSMALEMDATLWPNLPKKVNGTISGESFEMSYTPARDIGDNFTCDISYGFASGTSATSAIVTLLQLRGDGIIGRDTFRRQLPFDIDVDQQQRELDVQEFEDAIKQGLSAGLQATGQMIAQGQVSEAMTFFQAAAAAIKGRRNGDDLSETVIGVFQQMLDQQQQQAQQQAEAMQAAAGGAPGGPGEGPPDQAGDALQGVGPDGLPYGVAPGQAGMAPGGRPSVTDLSAGFTGSGKPSVGALVRRRIPTG